MASGVLKGAQVVPGEALGLTLGSVFSHMNQVKPSNETLHTPLSQQCNSDECVNVQTLVLGSCPVAEPAAAATPTRKRLANAHRDCSILASSYDLI